MYPYNNTKFTSYGAQGSPLEWDEAIALAYSLFRWHSDNDTHCWTQSGDGADQEIHHIALGLIAQSAEPNFLHTLAAVGESVAGSIETIAVLASRKRGDDDVLQALADAGIEVKRYLPPPVRRPWWRRLVGGRRKP